MYICSMEAVKENTNQESVGNQGSIVTPATEKQFVLNQSTLTALIQGLSRIAWIDANPLITLIQQNFREVSVVDSQSSKDITINK